MRKYLSQKQRTFLADFIQKMSLLAAGGLVFGQFIPGQKPNWAALVIGINLIIFTMAYAISLNKE